MGRRHETIEGGEVKRDNNRKMINNHAKGLDPYYNFIETPAKRRKNFWGIVVPIVVYVLIVAAFLTPLISLW